MHTYTSVQGVCVAKQRGEKVDSTGDRENERKEEKGELRGNILKGAKPGRKVLNVINYRSDGHGWHLQKNCSSRAGKLHMQN